MVFFSLAEGRPPKRRKRNLGHSVSRGTLFWCFLVWQRAAPQSTKKEIAAILSKEARRFGVFWFGRGAPSLLLKKKILRKGCILVFAYLYCVLARF